MRIYVPSFAPDYSFPLSSTFFFIPIVSSAHSCNTAVVLLKVLYDCGSTTRKEYRLGYCSRMSTNYILVDIVNYQLRGRENFSRFRLFFDQYRKNKR